MAGAERRARRPAAAGADALRIVPDGPSAARVAVHAKPGSRRPGVGGVHGDALVLAVAEPAADGRANRALVRLAAEALGVPPRAVELVSGAGARAKVLRVALPADEARRRLARLLAPS